MNKKQLNKLVDRWIEELIAVGFTPDEMIAVFREALKKYEKLKMRKQKL
ncbi:MAG: hypothetical protein JSR11_07750 [Bacteroidetes bacterium]|nr:hypothetical protein [Bacteroidota bacterium]